jgi:hypothetical protein
LFKIWWPKPLKELVAKAFEEVGGQGLIDDSGQSQAYKELLIKACL